MTTKTKVKLFFGFILSIAIIYFSVITLKDLDFSMLFRTNINWFYTIASVIIFIYANYIRGYAYTYGMDPEMDTLTAFRIVGIGHAANMILPLHIGEGLRIVFFPAHYSMLRRTKLLLIPGFADFVAIMILALLAVPFAGFKDPVLLKALWILLFLCLGGMALCAAAVIFVPRLRGYVQEYLNFGLAKMMFWVFLSWVLLLVSTWLGIAAYGFDLIESINLSLAVFAATNMVNFIPASPGGLGLFEYGTILAMGGLGVEKSPALAVGLLIHLIQYIALIPMGVALYISAIHGRYGDTLREVLHLRRK